MKKQVVTKIIFYISITCWVMYFIASIGAYFYGIEIDEKIGNITKTTVYYGNQGLQLALFTYFVTFAFFIPILTISLIYIIIYLIVKCKVKKKKCKQNINKESCEK